MDFEESILKQIFNEYKSQLIDHINDSSAVVKDSKLSEKARKEGNALFCRGVHDYDIHKQILECYCKSLALAPVNSEQHAFAYGNRSSFLLHLEKYNECIQDIDRALKITNCMQLKIKLLCRKIKCLKMLGKPFDEVIEQCESFLEKTENEDANKSQSLKLFEEAKQMQQKKSPKPAVAKDQYKKNLENIPKNCINQFDHVSIACNEKYGRHLIANRDFIPGEIVYIEDNYTATLFEEKIYLSCANCFQISWTGIPCHQCTRVIYCSEKCKEESWNNYHKIECEVIPILKLAQPNKPESVFIPLRMLIMGVKEFGSMAKLKKELKKLDDATDSSPDQFLKDGSKIKQSIKNIYILQSDGNYADEMYATFAGMGLKILFCLLKHSTFFGQKHSLKEIDDLMNDKNIFYTGVLLVKLCMVHAINVHSIQMMTDGDNIQFDSEFTGVVQPILSGLVNHSCFPNVLKSIGLNKKVIVFAMQPIQKGSQIFECYKMCMYGYFPKNIRDQMLSTCHFTCDCPACSENWPQLQELTLIEGMKSINLRDWISKECTEIMNAAYRTKLNFSSTELKILSQHVTTSIKKFKQPCSVTLMLLEVFRNALMYTYFLKLKSSIYGKCELMKTV